MRRGTVDFGSLKSPISAHAMTFISHVAQSF